MKKYHRLLFLMFALGLGAWRAGAADAAAKAAESPLAPIAFLAGGVWRGALPPTPDGKPLGLELRAEWTNNHRAIRFESAWAIGGKTAPYTSGLYAWDAAKKQIVLWYVDADGALTQGVVTLDGATLVHDLTITGADGKTSTARAHITPGGKDVYVNEIFLPKDGGWEKFVAVRYERDAAAVGSVAH